MLICGDARTIPLADSSVHCCVTSPPYWGLRDYGVAGQLGLERTPEEYIAQMVQVFREVKRVLRGDGTLWLNMGDLYAADRSYQVPDSKHTDVGNHAGMSTRGKLIARGSGRWGGGNLSVDGCKPKDLVGLPWMLAFALRADGWYLRAQCPWIKRNAMPESVKDRPGTATETIFLLSKKEKYFYDADAVKIPVSGTAHGRGNGVNPKALKANQHARIGKEHAPRHIECAKRNGKNETTGLRRYVGFNARWDAREARRSRQNQTFSSAVNDLVDMRCRRNHDWFMDSWEGLLTDDDGNPLAFVINPAPFPGAHCATFPEELIKPCILAGCPVGGIVLDPFVGSGTTVLVARELQCKGVGIELNPAYIEIAKRRLAQEVLEFA